MSEFKSFLDFIFVTGGFLPTDKSYVQTELFDFSSNQWKPSVAYPFGDVLFRAPTLHFNGYFYIFGATSSNGNSIISEFDPLQEKWATVGNLFQSRRMSRAILSIDKFMIIGDGTMVEVCSFSDDSNGLIVSSFYREHHIKAYHKFAVL